MTDGDQRRVKRLIYECFEFIEEKWDEFRRKKSEG
jgi:hypothetical protein